MPPKQQKSGLAAKYGAGFNDIVAETGAETTLPGQGFGLPPGIKDGRAHLIECKFDKYKSGDYEGEYYFRAAGVVQEPEFVEVQDGEKTRTVKVGGRQTSIMIPCCQTKNMAGKVTTQRENMSRVMANIRGLGGDTNGITADELEALAETLKATSLNPETPIFFAFSTSVRKAQTKGQPDGVWENWHGVEGLEDYVPPGGEIVGEDASGPAEGEEQAVLANGKAEVVTAPAGDEKTGPTDKEVDALVVKAKPSKGKPKGDGDAQTELVRLAVEALGWSMDNAEQVDKVENLPSWELIGEAAKTGKWPGEPEPEDDGEWKLGDPCFYLPMVPGPRGKLVQAKNAVECEIKALYPQRRQVDLVNLSDGKTKYPGVSMDDITPPE